MISKGFKRLLCLLIVIAVLFSVSVPAFAAEEGSVASSVSENITGSKLKDYFLTYQKGIIKRIVRLQFRMVAITGATLGCTTAAAMLNHALTDNPEDVKYDSSSKYAAQILKSQECEEIIARFKTNSAGKDEYTMSGGVALNSTPNLYLAYNAMSYTATGTKTQGVWNVTIVFSDKYDFDKMAWSKTFSANAVVAAVNNYAVYAQEIGAINNYYITVTVETSFTE